MDLYVANCTRQNMVFNYRFQGDNIKYVNIPIGKQQKIPGVSTQAQIDQVIKQHEPYGMIPVEEINRTKPFIGTCYSVDKLIKTDAIMKGLDHNETVLIERGREIRRAAAVQSNNMIENALHEANQRNNMDVKLDELEVMVQEADAQGRMARDGLQEGVTVTHNTGPNPVESNKPNSRRNRKN